MNTIKGYEKYSVDFAGNVYNGQKLLKPNYSRSRGYATVTLYGVERKSFLVHRLVLETFVGECPENMEACHNDGDKTNNSLDNLRWDTKSNNGHDKKKHGTLKCQKLSDQDVKDILWMLSLGTLYQKDIALMYGILQSQVSRIKTGVRWNDKKR
jgi:HNH endonuclease